MADHRISLREFQESLSRRQSSALRGATARSLLGVESGTDRWLVDLSDSGEVLPLPPLTGVPLTRPWFAGIANVRGTLYSIVDLAAFRGGEPARRGTDARLLLVGARHGIPSALLVERTVGLKPMEGWAVEPPEEGAPAWVGECHIDAQGRRWHRLEVKALLEDPEFLDIGA